MKWRPTYLDSHGENPGADTPQVSFSYGDLRDMALSSGQPLGFQLCSLLVGATCFFWGNFNQLARLCCPCSLRSMGQKSALVPISLHVGRFLQTATHKGLLLVRRDTVSQSWMERVDRAGKATVTTVRGVAFSAR